MQSAQFNASSQSTRRQIRLCSVGLWYQWDSGTRGTPVPVHPARCWPVSCPGSCCYWPLSAWGEASWQHLLCPGGLCGHRAAVAHSTRLLSCHRTAQRLFAPAHQQAEEDFSSEKTLSVLMQILMILHHSKKSGGEGKNPN